MLPRLLDIGRNVVKGKVLLVYGARRVGKTTLLKQYLEGTKLRFKLASGDDVRLQDLLSSGDFDRILGFVEGYGLLAIDEAQQVPSIGMALKILVDELPDLAVIATGSSSFDLAQTTGEPLTGRKRTFTLYPFSLQELLAKWNRFELGERMGEFLRFGMYPEVVLSRGAQRKIGALRELADSYLLKDVLSHEKIKASRQLLELLKLLAFQIGHEVSLNELATQIGLDVKTVGRYLDILEKAFVLVRLGGFSRNLRKEVTSSRKYYFWDTGIRNAVISQFNDVGDRSDLGQLFENFVIVERAKHLAYSGDSRQCYFWRTYDGQEIDLVEETEGHLSGYEIKWSPRRLPKTPGGWSTTYPGASFRVITPANVLAFVLRKSGKHHLHSNDSPSKGDKR